MQHNKVYATEEFYHRLHIFAENKRRIDHHNAGNHSYKSKVLHQPTEKYFTLIYK